MRDQGDILSRLQQKLDNLPRKYKSTYKDNSNSGKLSRLSSRLSEFPINNKIRFDSHKNEKGSTSKTPITFGSKGYFEPLKSYTTKSELIEDSYSLLPSKIHEYDYDYDYDASDSADILSNYSPKRIIETNPNEDASDSRGNNVVKSKHDNLEEEMALDIFATEEGLLEQPVISVLNYNINAPSIRFEEPLQTYGISGQLSGHQNEYKPDFVAKIALESEDKDLSKYGNPPLGSSNVPYKDKTSNPSINIENLSNYDGNDGLGKTSDSKDYELGSFNNPYEIEILDYYETQIQDDNVIPSKIDNIPATLSNYGKSKTNQSGIKESNFGSRNLLIPDNSRQTKDIKFQRLVDNDKDKILDVFLAFSDQEVFSKKSKPPFNNNQRRKNSKQSKQGSKRSSNRIKNAKKRAQLLNEKSRSSSNDRRTGSNDRRTGSNDGRTSSNVKRTGSNDRRTGSNDRRTVSNDKRTGSNDRRTGSNDSRTGSNGKRSKFGQRIGPGTNEFEDIFQGYI